MEEKVKRILGELMKEAFRDELLDAYLHNREVAICLTPRGVEKFFGEKNKVEIPDDAEFCIHTHFYSEELSPADLKVAKRLPVCTYYLDPDNGEERVKCVYNNELLALAEEYPEIKEKLEATLDWFNAEYNLREIVKQLILLEEHYKKARCSDCITKHLLSIEALAEEAVSLEHGEEYLDLLNEAHELAQRHLEVIHTSIHEDKAVNVYDMLQELRELRKKIMYKLFNMEPELNESVKQEVIPDTWRWGELKPKTKGEREELLRKFGDRCFLDPKALKFPICAYPSGAVSCDGLRAAFVRARSLMGATKDRHPELYRHYKRIADKALRLAKRFGCEWSLKEELDEGGELEEALETSKSKETEEKIRRLAKRVAKYFKQKYGIDEDLIDYYALVDPTLTYEENIKNIEKIVMKRREIQNLRDELIRLIMEYRDYWEQYAPHSYAVDKAKRAKRVFDLERSSFKSLEKWLQNPSRYDIKGIDTPEVGEFFRGELEEELEEQAPIRWTGGKRKLVKVLKEYIPPHRVYVEPFAGAAWLFWNKEPAEVEVLNDIDPRLIRFYKELRELDDLRAVIDRYGWPDGRDVERARALYRRAVEVLENWEEASREEFVWAFLYVNKFSYGGKMAGHDFNPAFTMPPKCPGEYCAIRGLLRNFERVKERLKRVTLENRDFREVIRAYDSPETFFYLDPPYYETGEADAYISNVMGKTPTPEEVLGAVKDIKGKFLLSYNDHPKIRELAKKYGFRVVEVTTTYEFVKRHYGAAKLAKELLIMNF